MSDDERDELFVQAAEAAYEIGVHVGLERRADHEWWSGWSWGLCLGVLTATTADILWRLL